MKTFVIAEAGVNHNGSIQIAKQLVDVAVNAGADAVKFQTFKAENLVCRIAPKAEYQKQNDPSDESQYEMLKKLELSATAHFELADYCKPRGIIFLSTPFDHDSIDFLNNLEMPIFKIPSGEITNLPYLRHVGRLGKEVILSTGMADLGEVEDALDVLMSQGLEKEKITVLHTTTEYPCSINEVNLRAMQTMRNAFAVEVGYSDHTPGIEVAIAAVALGAVVIEKHFTLDRNLPGPDHKASLEASELREMVSAIRNIELALGDGIKRLTPSEVRNKPVARKSLAASRSIKTGEVFSSKNITPKRPGTGISPMRWDEMMGRVSLRDYEEDELIEF